MLIAKPLFPWPDVEAFVDRIICMAGLGLAVNERLPADTRLPLAELVRRLELLRPDSGV